MGKSVKEQVVSPGHYIKHPSGIECWEVNGQLNGNVCAAFKYVFRRHHKATVKLNIEKACQYLRREHEELASDHRRQCGFRFIVQPERKFEFKTLVHQIREYEENPRIRRFYQLIVMAAFATRAPSQMVLLGTASGVLAKYLIELEAGSTVNVSQVVQDAS